MLLTHWLSRDLLLCCLGDGEVVEQVLGQQTAEERQEVSPLDNLIRQLQDEQQNAGPPEDASGVFYSTQKQS